MSIQPKIEATWKKALKKDFESPYFVSLKSFLNEEKETQTIYPKGADIFRAFEKTPLPKVKVVILGQDPYHGPNQANGLSFSVNQGVPFPPSLRNIYKELSSDLGISIPKHGDLSSWADQGVLMLNSVLTVRAKEAASHKNKGWETFTDSVIRTISHESSGVVFILWGNYARNKGKHIDRTKHHILFSAHPSPLSAHNGFFGSRPFSQTNSILSSLNREPINWASAL